MSEEITPHTVLKPAQVIEGLEEELEQAISASKYISSRFNTLSEMLETCGCVIAYPVGLDFAVINERADNAEDKYNKLLKLIKLKMPENSIKAEILGEITDESK